MKRIGTVLREIYGLFVEDGMLAVGAVAWILAVSLLLPHLALLPLTARPLLLFAGLAAVLVASVLRAARAPRKR